MVGVRELKFPISIVHVISHKRNFGKNFADDKDATVDICGLMLDLEVTRNRQRIIVAGAHLKSAKDINGEKIRIKQLSWFVPQLEKYQEKVEKELSKSVPIFFGCDLNGPPINTKGFEPFAYTSIVESNTRFRSMVEEHNKKQTNELEKLNLVDYGYEQQWSAGLSSAYRDALGKEPEYTTWKKRVGGTDQHTIDYIFYQKHKNVFVSKYLNIPSEKEVNHETLIPGWEYPSDHFSILVEFGFDSLANRKNTQTK